MPSLSDAIITAGSITGYSPVSTPSTPTAAPPSSDLEPGRNNVIRCPLPPLWQASPDSLRQFYIKGQVPQMRLMTPNPTTPSGSSTAKVSSVTGTFSGGGSSGGGSSTTAASQAVVTTPVLPPGNKFVGAIALPKGFQLLTLAVGSPCRIQFYGTANAQSQDLARALDVPPPAGTAQDVICDVALDTAPYQWSFQNRVGHNADSPQKATIYVTVTNLDATSDAVTLTVQYLQLES